MDEQKLKSIGEFLERARPLLENASSRASLAARPDMELVPIPRDLLEGLFAPGLGLPGRFDTGASAGGDFFAAPGQPDFGRPLDPFVNPPPTSQPVRGFPGGFSGGFPGGIPGRFPGGLPGDFAVGASAGGFLDFGVPEFGRPVFASISPLDAQLVAKAKPDLQATLDGFLDALEAGDVDKAMSFVDKDFASTDGANAAGLKERLQAMVDSTERRRLVVRRTEGIQVGRDQIAARMEVTGGARLAGGQDMDLGSGMRVDVIFDKTRSGWKISALSPVK